MPPSDSDTATPPTEEGVLSTGSSEGGHEVPSSDQTDVHRRLALLEAENGALRSQLENGNNTVDELIILDDERVLQSVGIYRYHHPLENAVAFKERLNDLGTRIADLVKSGEAIERSNMFTFDNSLAKGRKMTNDLSKLMLRAYNAEADNSIRSLRLGNVVTAERRLEASRTAIARLRKMMEMRISDAFHQLRLEEIELTSDWLMKKQEEKEAAKEERARLREERRVEKELAEERARLDKERAHIENALAALRESGDDDPELEARLAELDDAIAQNDYRAANIRAGYVYVISNRGAFGENVVKIGLTRRLEPHDRITELSGASVPFRFDVHALFFSEDAVSLETELHQHFADRAVNMANSRKEFFFASPAEVRQILTDKVGNLLEFTDHTDATEYIQSLRYWPDLVQPPGVRHPTSSIG
ncbi:T5orf172 domain protein [bacterium BMS3Bbin01]|nr:T5orf172 domain protein [bacterium BMS3Bbin01]